MIHTYRAIVPPSHVVKAFRTHRMALYRRDIIDPVPPLAYFLLGNSLDGGNEALYLEDRLGPGGLLLDRWEVAGDCLYWSSSRLGLLSEQLAPNLRKEDSPLSGRGLILGKLNGRCPPDPTEPLVWKKARLTTIEVNFSPSKGPAAGASWPGGAVWKEL